MKRTIFIFLSFLFFLIPLFFIFQYDIYSYHVWAYNSLKYGVSELYTNENYFDRLCDYMPFGSYIAILTGRVISFFKPLTLISVPYLNLYKIFPLLFLFSFLIFLIKERYTFLKIFLFVSIFYFSIFLNGQFDIIILFLIFFSIFLYEQKKFIFASFLLTLLIFSKPTAPFFVLLIYLHYFKENGKKNFLIKTIPVILFTSFLIFLPFIIKGKLIFTLKNIYFNSIYMLPFSGYSFNLLSLIPQTHYLDPAKNFLNLSLRTYSLILLFLFCLVISFLKGNIFKKMALFSLLWINLLVGLRENHILYPLFFLFFTLEKKDFKFKIIFLILYFVSFMNIAFFIFSFSNKFLYYLFVSLSSISTVILFILLLKSNDKILIPKNLIILEKVSITYLLLIFVFLIFPLKNYDRKEKNFFGEIITSKDLLDYSKEKFLDLNIKTYSPFSHYLSLRLSDLSYFKFKNLKEKYKDLVFYLDVENDDSAKLLIDDTISIYVKEGERKVVKIKDLVKYKDTLLIRAKTFEKNSNLIIYKATF
uniref:DUF2029 domain-containing protein n=1 Tax=candidate division WOR-3 bacterium TaxID=2052148 RepID=A0A7C3N5Z4_UNCW3